MPVSASAGISRMTAGFPECNPMPRSEICEARVRRCIIDSPFAGPFRHHGRILA